MAISGDIFITDWYVLNTTEGPRWPVRVDVKLVARTSAVTACVSAIIC